jgi:5-methylcytosine-specific restriction endonuclease McrA
MTKHLPGTPGYRAYWHSRTWIENNREKRNAMQRRWTASHPGYYKEYWRKYRSEHRGEIRVRNQMRKVKIKRAFNGDPAVAVMLNQWQSEPTFICHYCKKEFDTKLLQVEHKTPLSRGGLHSIANLTKSCGPCNYKKKNKTEEEFCGSL